MQKILLDPMVILLALFGAEAFATDYTAPTNPYLPNLGLSVHTYGNHDTEHGLDVQQSGIDVMVGNQRLTSASFFPYKYKR